MVGHSCKHFANVGGRELESTAFVDVTDFCLGCSRGQVWYLAGFGVVRRHDLNRLNTVVNQSGNPYGAVWKVTNVKGSSVYWENIVTRILFTISTFVLSNAVISRNTFLVLGEIFE